MFSGRTNLVAGKKFSSPGSKPLNKGAGARSVGKAAAPVDWSASSTAIHPTVKNALKALDRGFIDNVATVHGMPLKKLHTFVTKRGFALLSNNENLVSYRKVAGTTNAAEGTREAQQSITVYKAGEFAGVTKSKATVNKVVQRHGDGVKSVKTELNDVVGVDRNGIVVPEYSYRYQPKQPDERNDGLGWKQPSPQWSRSSTAVHPNIMKALQAYDRGFVGNVARVQGMPPKKLHSFLTQRGFEPLPNTENGVHYVKTVRKTNAGVTTRARQSFDIFKDGEYAGVTKTQVWVHQVTKEHAPGVESVRIDLAEAVSVNRDGVVVPEYSTRYQP